ncbi:MAG: hypothetical protein HY456_00455 [Parcubacteria group bacterium]|nr:hypothetical protein [Parcubacteria group bacterium]
MAKNVISSNVRRGDLLIYSNRAGNYVFARVFAFDSNDEGEATVLLDRGRPGLKSIAVSRLQEMKAKIVSEKELLRHINELGKCFSE